MSFGDQSFGLCFYFTFVVLKPRDFFEGTVDIFSNLLQPFFKLDCILKTPQVKQIMTNEINLKVKYGTENLFPKLAHCQFCF